MGLSIHYSGSLSNPDYLSEIIEEVKDIAEVFKWEYNIYEERFPENTFGKTDYNQNIYGISFTIPDCETISISFLSNGKISCPLHLQFYGKTDKKPEQEFLYMLSVKTQFVGSELHKFIIHLFQYLTKKYFKDFKMIDEGGYWESGNEKILEQNFQKYTDLLNSFSSAIKNQPIKSGESFEAYFERLLKQIHDKKKK